MNEPNERNDLDTKLQVLLQAIEVKDQAISSKIDKQAEEITQRIADSLLQNIHQALTTVLESSIDKIAVGLNEINEKIESANRNDGQYTQLQVQSLDEAEVRIRQLLENLDNLDKKGIKRFFLGICIAVVISTTATVIATSYMIRTFPTRVIISNPKNILLQDSEVSLWGTDNTKVLKKVTKK